MAHDREQIQQLACACTEAWCSRDPQQAAAHYVPVGSIAINGGDPTRIAEVAEAFIAGFPDIGVVMDDLVLRDDGSVEYRWTFTGTSAESGHERARLRIRRVGDRAERADRRVTRTLRPSRVRALAPARRQRGPVAQLRRHSRDSNRDTRQGEPTGTTKNAKPASSEMKWVRGSMW
jgi:hypothetical protein